MDDPAGPPPEVGTAGAGRPAEGDISEGDRVVLEALRAYSAPVVHAVEDEPGAGWADDGPLVRPGPGADDGLGPQFREPPGDA